MSKSIYDQEYRKLIGDLRLARKAAGMTQQDVASRADVKALSHSDLDEFVEAYDYFIGLVRAHSGGGGAAI